MEYSALISLLGSTLLTIGWAAVLGHFMSKQLGAILFGLLSAIAAAICFGGAMLKVILYHQLDWSWPGLVGAMIAVAALAALLSRKLFSPRGAIFASSLWAGWCVFCLFGYLAAGISGLVLITLPSVATFWAGACVLTQKLLPLRKDAPKGDRLKALRALLTYALGTNYPYYTVENRKATLRVPGNPFRAFFAGPGIIITSCDHTVVITDNLKIRQILDPGLSFTGMYEAKGEVIDLRAQLRAFHVEAITKDGIRIKVLTFAPFRIAAGRWPQPGESFPFRKSAVFQAVQGQLVERSREQKDGKLIENKQQHTWDETVNIVTTQIVRRIIGEYSFDELCAPYQLQEDPRQKIGDELRKQLKDELQPKGIEALGGGISNLLPMDTQLLRQRVGNWQAEWERRITAEIGKGEAEYIRMVESARAQAQAEMIRTISEGFERAGATENISTVVIALRFVEALEKMIKSPAIQQALPPASSETIEAIKRSIESHRR